jgi:hypothetical protein
MIRWICFFVLSMAAMTSPAQEPLMPQLSGKDSTLLEIERQVMYRQLLSGMLPAGHLMEPMPLPGFDLDAELSKRWQVDPSVLTLDAWEVNGWIPGFTGLSGSPFLRNETVFSGSVYRLNDRFSLGGYSFGANSVFTAPLPNQGMNPFDVRGSTLFMQYKVSKNFKIETRVNVTHGPGY